MNRGRGRRGPAPIADLQAWDALIRDPNPPLMPPYGMEKQARDEFGVRYVPTCDADRDDLQRISWPWSTACVWVAWQTFDGAADGVAAFRYWRGMIWREGREGDPDVRPGRLMPLDAAERALRNALEAGNVQASAVHGDNVVPIPAGDWPRLAWERAEHGEVIEFGRLLMLGVPRYEGVTLPRAAVMRLWPALDGWMPDGVVGVVEDAPTEVVEPIDVTFREMAKDGVADDVPLLTPPPTRQERLNAIAREMPTGLQWKRGGSKKAGEPIEYQFYRAIEGEFGEHVSRDGEAWEAWRHHYPYRPKSGRPRRSEQK